jgi:hypothetical protein
MRTALPRNSECESARQGARCIVAIDPGLSGAKRSIKSSASKMAALSADKLRTLLRYDPETGFFTWKATRRGCSPSSNAGTVSKDTGYRIIVIDYRQYRAHRLAYLYMTGAWPAEEIDHRNGVRDDNRWVNLRHATVAQNCRNSRLRADNTSGTEMGVISQGFPKVARYDRRRRKRI